MSNGGGRHGMNVHEDAIRRRNASQNAVRDYRAGIARRPGLSPIPIPVWPRWVIVLAIVVVFALALVALR